MMYDEKADVLVGEERAPALARTRPRRGLNDQAQKRLGLHLRAMYESVVQQPVPDRFKDLIARLDENGTGPEKA